MEEKFKITFNENGVAICLSENTSDGYGHAEGGFLTREQPNFAEELTRHLRIASVSDFIKYIQIAEQGEDPILRRAIGDILLEMNAGAYSIIKDTRQAQKAEAKAREEAQEKAKRRKSFYIPNIDDYGGRWVTYEYNPETGAIGKPIDDEEAPKDPQDSIITKQEEDGPSLL